MNNVYHNRFFAMGTRFHAIFPNMDDAGAERAFFMVKDEINRIEKKLSRFIPESEISKINAKAYGQKIKLDEELFDILTACKFCWEITGGAFDLTLRPLLEFWKQQKETGKEVYSEDFEGLKQNVGFEHVIIDNEERTVAFANEMIQLDLGGFGKGYALEKVQELLTEAQVKNAFISFGESSILALGNHPTGSPWRVGMNDYLKPGTCMHEFSVSWGSVSTSSNFFLDDRGSLTNHNHVINPVTGKPHRRCTSVSVSAPSPLLAEMMSTAFLISDDEHIRRVKEKYEQMEVIKADYESGESIITCY